MTTRRSHHPSPMKGPFSKIFRRLVVVPRRFILGFATFLMLLILGVASVERWNQSGFVGDGVLGLARARAALHSCEEKFVQLIASRQALLEKISSLEQSLIETEKLNLKATAVQEENDYLRSLLPLVDGKNLGTLTVTAVPKPSDPYMVLSYETSDLCASVQTGDVAFTPQGFLGTVLAKKDSRLLVLLATHVRSRIPVVARQSRKEAILFGNHSSYFSIRFVRNPKENSGPFVKNPNAKQEFVEGEILEYCSKQSGVTLPVAKIVKKDGHIMAEWLVTTPSRYITLLLASA